MFTQSHPKILLLTLLFFSSSNTGFFGRGEGDGINVASRGISGSTNTIPKIKMTTNSYCTLEMTIHGIQGDKITLKAQDSHNQLFSASFMDVTVKHWYCVIISSQHILTVFKCLLSLSPCDFSIRYASQIFASSGRDTVQLYSIVITLVFTLSDTLSPRY